MNLNEICSIYRVFGWGKSNYTFNVELGSTRTEIKALGGSLLRYQNNSYELLYTLLVKGR